MTLKKQQAFPQPLSNGSFRPFSQKSPGAGTKSKQQQQQQPPLVPVKGFPPRQQRRHSYGGGAPLSTRSSSCSGTPHLEDKRGRSLSLPESPSWLHQLTSTISTPGSSSSKNSRRSRSSGGSTVVTTRACPICGLTLTYRLAAAHVKACSTSLIDRQQRRYLQDAERRELKRYHHKKLHAAAGATTTTTTTTPPSEPAELVSLSLGVELVTVQSAATLGPNSASATSIVVPTTLQLVPAHLVEMSATSILSQKVEGSSAEDFVLSDDSELGSPPATVLSRKIHAATTTTTTTTTTTATLPVSSTLKLEPPDPRVGMLVAELPPCAVPAHGNRFHPALAPTAVRSPYAEVIPNFGSSSSNGSSSYVGRGVSSSGGGSNSSTTYVVGEPSVRYYRVLSAPASAEF